MRALEGDADAAIGKALSSIRTGLCDRLQTAIRLTDEDDARAYVATLVPFRLDHDTTGLFADFTADAMPIAMLTVVDPEASRAPANHALATMYGLTPAETDLANGIFGGDSLKSYARARGVSINTVRNQLQSIFSKTDTHKQSDVVALIGRFSAG